MGVLISDPLFITSSTSISSGQDRSNAPPLVTLDTAATGGGERARCREERSRSCCCFSIFPPSFAFAFSLAARLFAVATAVAQAASSHFDEDDKLDFFDSGRRLEYDRGAGAPGAGVVRVEDDCTLRFFDKTGLGGASGEVLWEWRVTIARVLFLASEVPFALFSSLVLLWTRTTARLCGLANTAVKAACGDWARAADAAAWIASAAGALADVLRARPNVLSESFILLCLSILRKGTVESIELALHRQEVHLGHR